MTSEPAITESVASQEHFALRGLPPAEALAKSTNLPIVNSPTLNIAHVVDSMEMGGAEKLTAMLCRLQRGQGHHASVHCLYLLGVLGEQLRDEGFDVALHRPTSFLGLMRSLYRTFKRSTPDVAHFHNPTAAIVGALPARLAGVKTLVVTRHSLVSPPYQLRCELKFALASRLCDSIVGVCKATRTNLLGAPWAERGKIIHIYNGAPPANKGAIPRPKCGFTLLHVGRLVAAKDHASLLRAVAHARVDIRNLQLWIVGDGPLRPNLERLSDELGLSKCVTFFGEQADIAPFLAAADLFVMSSISEGLPVALLEAMSAGLPAVVTDVGGMAEVARLSRAATLVPPSHPEALARALRNAARQWRELPAIGQLAHDCYEAHFTPDSMNAQYLRLYSQPRRREQ